MKLEMCKNNSPEVMGGKIQYVILTKASFRFLYLKDRLEHILNIQTSKTCTLFCLIIVMPE